MEREFIENILLTVGVVICVLFFVAFLLLNYLSKRIDQTYLRGQADSHPTEAQGPTLVQKITDWYLTRGALPFWYVFGVDCLILIYSQLMSAYLVLGGQVLVPMFWDYIILAISSLPFYYIGMKLFRSYETIVRFSKMEDLARIVCALFVGTILVDVVKHFIPETLLLIYPIWQEQLIMFICAVVLMWSVRILVKTLYDNTAQETSRIRSYIFGTSIQSIAVGLETRRETTGKGKVLAFIRANDKEPHTTLEGADILNPDQDIVASMVENLAETLIVPITAYPDFCQTHQTLIESLLANRITILLHQ